MVYEEGFLIQSLYMKQVVVEVIKRAVHQRHDTDGIFLIFQFAVA